MVSVNTLLDHLPPYQEYEQVIHYEQTVSDIIKEVLSAHEVFAEDYDGIADFFYADDTEQMCRNLFDFCKDNISYEIETKDDQTTRSPAAILELGNGDCKHYAGFIGGILDALKRKGDKIDWFYRFASYDLLDTEPGHVFIVVKNGKDEIWIDPVLSEFDERLMPQYITDKKVKMLSRLSGFQFSTDPNTTEIYVNHRAIGKVIDIVFGSYIFGDNFLGLSAYADNVNASNVDFNALTAQINQALIDNGRNYTLTPEKLRYVFDHSIKNWNFLYAGGVDPYYNLFDMPAEYPLPVQTEEGRLTLSNNNKITSYDDNLYKLTAAIQNALNHTAEKSYILTPLQVVEFSKQNDAPYTGSFYNLKGAAIGDIIDIGISLLTGLFGGGGTKQPTAAQNAAALADLRANYFPGPNSCLTGQERLPIYVSPGVWDRNTPCGSRCNYINTALQSMQRVLNEVHIPDNDLKYINAYNVIMQEYKTAQQQYCQGQSYLSPTLPGSGTTSTGVFDWIKQNPVISLLGAGAAYYFFFRKRKKSA